MVESTLCQEVNYKMIEETLANLYRDEEILNKAKLQEKAERDNGNLISRQIIDQGAWVKVKEAKLIVDLVPQDFYEFFKAKKLKKVKNAIDTVYGNPINIFTQNYDK